MPAFGRPLRPKNIQGGGFIECNISSIRILHNDLFREYIEYPDKVEFKELIAQPGETVAQEIRIPYKIHYADGTIKTNYETAVFSLTNAIQENIGSGLTSQPLATTTYVICSGNLNTSNRKYTSAVSWHYDGSHAWRDSDWPATHIGYWPYTDDTYSSSYYGNGNWKVNVWTSAHFSAVSPWTEKWHDIDWELLGSGACSATGSIY